MQFAFWKPLFDHYHYAQVSGAHGTAAELWAHFKAHGAAQGMSPTPLFDPQWYLREYMDVAAAGISPLRHYAEWGSREGRAPHPLIDPDEARAACAGRTGHVLHRYSDMIATKRGSLHPLFWPDWYAASFADRAGVTGDLFAHYITQGWRQGASPNPLFDVAYYRDHHMKDALGTMSPLEHFVSAAKCDHALSPHKLFDAAHYRSELSRRGIKPKVPLYQHYLASQDAFGAASPHPLFWPDFYRRKSGNQVLEMPALVHYLQTGAAGADPSPYFSRKTYLAHAPDVADHGIDALTHYVSAGAAEGRKFHPLFDPSHYEAQGRYRAATALEDYLTRGVHAGRKIRPAETPDEATRPLPGTRDVVEMSFGATARLESGQGESWQRIGIFAHIFYPAMAEEIAGYCNNAPADRTTVFISTDCAHKARSIETTCKASLNHHFEIRVCDNRGRDIAPWLVGFADRMDQVDVGVHVHSKASPQYGGEFMEWRHYLLDQTLGSKALVDNILDLLAQDGIGAYCPEHHPTVRPLLQWGGNFETCAALIAMMGGKLDRRQMLDLPSGSMFWFRTDALRPLLDLDLQTGHFDPEAGQEDGTLAHAIERILLMTVETAGYSYVTGHSKSDGALLPLAREQLAQLVNRIHPTSRDQGDAARYLPHCAGYLTQASDVSRPRVNLLIPTVDTSRAYAGVATGLEVFHAIRRELGQTWDARLIPTDMAFGPGYTPPKGYAVQGLECPDKPGQDTVLPGYDRRFGPVNLRPGDVFMATAWWTAHQARALLDDQRALFGHTPGKFAYLVQDYENGFQAWSTAWALADATYRDAQAAIPIFNTQILSDFFRDAGYPLNGPALDPALNATFAAAMNRDAPKERLVLLYARTHAERNCLSFLDMVVAQTLARDPELWKGWRFLAIGEDFQLSALKCDARIEVLGRLHLKEYAALASRAALGLSLMVSPHPSYPPLEMAAAGVRVLTNKYAGKDLSDLHPNIESFDIFSAGKVADHLSCMARDWQANPQKGWTTRPHVDWFFQGGTNLPDVARSIASDLRDLVLPFGAPVSARQAEQPIVELPPILKAAG